MKPPTPSTGWLIVFWQMVAFRNLERKIAQSIEKMVRKLKNNQNWETRIMPVQSPQVSVVCPCEASVLLGV